MTQDLANLRMGDGESLMTSIRRARTLKAELAGAGNQVGEDTAVMHVLAGLPPAYKTVTTVLLSAGVPLQWDQQLPALLPVEVEQKEAALNFAGEPSVAYSVNNPAGSHGRFGSRGSGATAAKQLSCWYCKKPGHSRRECRKQAADKERRGGRGGDRGQGAVDDTSGAVAFTTTINNKRAPMPGQAAAASQSEWRSRIQRTWVIYSGASHHMTENSSNWANCISIGVFSVTLADGKTAEAVGKGSLHLTHQTDVPVDLEEVLYVPGLADNLLSVRAETRHGGKINFVGDTCTVRSPTRLVVTGMPNPKNQYEVVVQEAPTAAEACVQASSEKAHLWHGRYCRAR